MNFIYVHEDRLSSDVCEELINLFEHHQDLQEDGVTSGQKVDKKIKKSKDISIGPSFYSNSYWGFSLNKCLDFLQEGLNVYKEKFSEYSEDGSKCILGLDSIADWGLYEYYNIQKYFPGDAYYSWHCEAGNTESSNRIMAWMIYLNDVNDGGETEFKFQNYKSKAEKGKLLIWPAAWTHVHRGVASQSETKYIITGWFTFNESIY